MKHLRRWLFNLAALASLLLCILMIAAWFLRTSAADLWTFTRSIPPPANSLEYRTDIWQLTFSSGEVFFDRYQNSRSDAWDPARRMSAFSKFKHDAELPTYVPDTVGWTFGGMSKATLTRKSYFVIGNFEARSITYTIATVWRQSQWSLRVPLWFLVAIFALLPLIWEIRYRQKLAITKRARRGFCAKCGYDLRATPQCCPECGTVPRKTRLWLWNVDYFWK